MCGITGILNVDSQMMVDAQILRRMTDALIHRGPDDSGIFVDGNVGLGFRRLSIIDLSSAGHQPMLNDDGSICIVLNGEIYNFRELRRELETKGFKFRSKTDTEVVLKLYQAEGESFVRKLRGMFAIAIWDSRTRKLILARDRVGKKPLYYYYDGNTLLFGSELKSILQYPGLNLQYDPAAICEYFSYGYINSPRSIYKNVCKVLPAHFLVFGDGDPRESEYWQVDFSHPYRPEQRSEALEELRTLVDESVRMRMVSDVPLGAFLSGGIDSTAVVAFLARNSSRPVKTFSIGFEEEDHDETRYARLVSEHFGTEHYEEIVRPDYVHILQDIILDFDEPFGDSSALPTYVVSKTTRKHVTVALSGDGGDELFAGYELHRIALRELAFDKFPKTIKKSLQSLSKIYPDVLRGGGLLRRMGAPSPQHRYIDRMFIYNPAEQEQIFSNDFLDIVRDHDAFRSKRMFFEEAGDLDFLTQITYNDLKHYLPGDILVKVDRMSMLNSLETRCPLLDHHIVEFAFRCPPAWKFHEGRSKVLLKEMLKGLVPEEILHREKKGFAIPAKKWFSHELHAFARDLLNSREIIESGLFNMTSVNQYLKAHQHGMRDHSAKLWLLLAFSLFLRGEAEKRRPFTSN